MLIRCWWDVDPWWNGDWLILFSYLVLSCRHGLFGTGDVQWICSEQVGSGALRAQSIPQWFAGCGFPPWHALGELHHRLQGDSMRYTYYISCFSWESIGTDFLLSNTLDKACHSCSWSRADCFKLLCMRWGKESLSTWIQSAETMQTTGVASFISFPVQVAAIPTSFLLALSPAALVLAVLLRRDLHVMWLRWTTLPRSGIEWNWCQIHCSGQRAKTIQNT